MRRRRRYPVTKALWVLYAVGSTAGVCCILWLPLAGLGWFGEMTGSPAPPGYWPVCWGSLFCGGALLFLFFGWLFDRLLDERIEMGAETIRRGISD